MREHSDHNRRRSGWRPLLLGFLTWSALDGAVVHAQSAPVLFSEAQAMRGEAVYQQYCATCHGPRLEGNPAAPLTGAAFRSRWEDGQHTLDDLFYIVRSLMPNSAPGSLTKAQYADVVAYILKINGYPAGDSELVPTVSAMKAVRLEPH